MSSHEFTVVVYLLVAFAGLLLEAISKLPGSKLPGLEQVLSWVMRSRMGRVGVMTGWAWVGMHYFAR